MKKTKEEEVKVAGNAGTNPNAPKSVDQQAQEILKQIQKDQDKMNNLTDYERAVLIKDFNMRNEGIAKLEKEKPDQAFIDQCKKDFESYQQEYLKLDYEISTGDQALEQVKWLQEWNHNYAVARKNYWKGILHFDEVIKKVREELEKEEDKKFVIDYGALTYLYNMMMEPLGIGYDYAKWMSENDVMYNTILNKVGDHIDKVTLIKKKIGMLQSRWALACSGFKMTILLEKLEDYEKVTGNI